MNSQFKKGVVELCILKLISQKDMSSFEVLDNISHEIEVNENTIYPILRRLTNDGLLVSRKGDNSIGAPRKYYSLTEEGTLHLNELEGDWLNFVNRVSNILGGNK